MWLKGTPNGSQLSNYIYAIAKKIKMAIYIKSTILKLEKKVKNILQIFFIVYIEHVKFQEASFNSN